MPGSYDLDKALLDLLDLEALHYGKTRMRRIPPNTGRAIPEADRTGLYQDEEDEDEETIQPVLHKTGP